MNNEQSLFVVIELTTTRRRPRTTHSERKWSRCRIRLDYIKNKLGVRDSLNVRMALQKLSPGKYIALSSPLLALTNGLLPQETNMKETTDYDHVGRAQSKQWTSTATTTDNDVSPRTTMCHHNARANPMDDNAPTTMTMMHNQQQ